jgi:hypothetical protein
MTLIALPTLIHWPMTPNSYRWTNGTGAIDAAGEKVSQQGRVWWPGDPAGTKQIVAVGVQLNTTTTITNGSTARVSLQDPDLAGVNLETWTPDGTQDQYADFTSATAGTWNRWTLSANRTVSFGDPLCIVFEWQSFNAGDVVGFRGYQCSYNEKFSHGLLYTVYNGASWGQDLGNFPGPALYFSDGSVGCFFGSPPMGPMLDPTFNSSSTPDEYGQKFQLPFPARLAGFWVRGRATSGSPTLDYDLVLYSGTTPLRTMSYDAVTFPFTDEWTRLYGLFSSPYDLAADTDYIIALKPTSATGGVETILTQTKHPTDWDHRGLDYNDTAEAVTRTDGGSWSTYGAAGEVWDFHAGLLLSGVDL